MVGIRLFNKVSLLTSIPKTPCTTHLESGNLWCNYKRPQTTCNQTISFAAVRVFEDPEKPVEGSQPHDVVNGDLL